MTGRAFHVPGDKSITHRALMIAALAEGDSVIEKPLLSADTRSTMHVLRMLGVNVREPDASGAVRVTGAAGRFRDPAAPLDCGNSGTTARLLLGLLAGAGVQAVVTGDESLRRRPVRRVTVPLAGMGARFAESDDDAFPVELLGGPLRSFAYDSPVASAQVKSAILLAGLAAGVEVEVTEPGASRDHTERMLAALGEPVTWSPGRARLGPARPVTGFHHVVPGDPSSAAFLAGAALWSGGVVRIRDVCVNPTRVGFVAAMRRMGVGIEVVGVRDLLGEPVGDLVVRPGELQPVVVHPDEVPTLIDEIPLLAVLAACARGTSRFEGVGELRVKETNRLEMLRANLAGLGVGASVEGDTLVVEGRGSAPCTGRIETGRDHRLAMAFAVLGSAPGNRISLSEAESPDISFPGFAHLLATVVAS